MRQSVAAAFPTSSAPFLRCVRDTIASTQLPFTAGNFAVGRFRRCFCFQLQTRQPANRAGKLCRSGVSPRHNHQSQLEARRSHRIQSHLRCANQARDTLPTFGKTRPTLRSTSRTNFNVANAKRNSIRTVKSRRQRKSREIKNQF